MTIIEIGNVTVSYNPEREFPWFIRTGNDGHKKAASLKDATKAIMETHIKLRSFQPTDKDPEFKQCPNCEQNVVIAKSSSGSIEMETFQATAKIVCVCGYVYIATKRYSPIELYANDFSRGYSSTGGSIGKWSAKESFPAKKLKEAYVTEKLISMRRKK